MLLFRSAMQRNHNNAHERACLAHLFLCVAGLLLARWPMVVSRVEKLLAVYCSCPCGVYSAAQHTLGSYSKY